LIVWDFVAGNAHLGAAILKLHDAALDDSKLKKRTPYQNLFSNSFARKPEYLSGPDAVHEAAADQVGCYMYEDVEGLGFIRAGSAANGLGKRHKEHVTASKQTTKEQQASVFYSAYPDEASMLGDQGKIGNFHQLRQVTGVRFKKGMQTQVVDMFHWDERTLQMLERSNPKGCSTLLAKKHRMVCYFFEKMFDLMLGLDNNLSSNPGFECFVGKWDGGYGKK